MGIRGGISTVRQMVSRDDGVGSAHDRSECFIGFPRPAKGGGTGTHFDAWVL
jgi:hypothetical protein